MLRLVRGAVSGGSVPSELRRLLAVLKGVRDDGGHVALYGNPWSEPPEAVVKSGMAAVITYFDDLYSAPCRVQRNSVKVVLVGQEGAGKTSLCRSMKIGRATPRMDRPRAQSSQMWRPCSSTTSPFACTTALDRLPTRDFCRCF